jgi:hypothetical protein
MVQIMGRTREVVVEGDGENLDEISEYSGQFTACKVRVKVIGNERKSIGTACSLEDALTLIRSHSGRQVEHVG